MLVMRKLIRRGAAIETPDLAASALSNTARENFCLIHVAVDLLDWVYLSSEGNRRAQFSWANGELTSQWLAP
ncbi:MAG: hypothetical protein HC782_02445 [Gammaproteobacteria bacterium]|nr:hypothetical protein [Gammaproteobacteria bacterium]